MSTTATQINENIIPTYISDAPKEKKSPICFMCRLMMILEFLTAVFQNTELTGSKLTETNASIKEKINEDAYAPDGIITKDINAIKAATQETSDNTTPKKTQDQCNGDVTNANNTYQADLKNLDINNMTQDTSVTSSQDEVKETITAQGTMDNNVIGAYLKGYDNEATTATQKMA